jgi:hypothetical protein
MIVEDIYELDVDDGLGSWMGVIIDGHVENDVALPIAWASAIEYGRDVTFGCPRRTHLRKVPLRDGGWRASYSRNPGRGAKAVTVVEEFTGWHERCYRCPWTAVVAVPVDRFTDPPAGAKFVYYCREHADDFHARWKEALRVALERAGEERNAVNRSAE